MTHCFIFRSLGLILCCSRWGVFYGQRRHRSSCSFCQQCGLKVSKFTFFSRRTLCSGSAVVASWIFFLQNGTAPSVGVGRGGEGEGSTFFSRPIQTLNSNPTGERLRWRGGRDSSSLTSGHALARQLSPFRLSPDCELMTSENDKVPARTRRHVCV